jgi:hypothetical protein
MTFSEWINNKSVISYDFDGVLHKNTYPGTIMPLDLYTDNLTPNDKMLNQLRSDSKNYKIIIVTARNNDGQMDKVVYSFIKKYNLPVSKVFFTNGGNKLPILQQQHAIKHYDDNPAMQQQLQGTGIEFVLISNMQEDSGMSFVATPRQEYDSGLNREQNYKPPKIKKNKIDKKFNHK